MASTRPPAWLVVMFTLMLAASLAALWMIAHLLLRTPASWMAVASAVALAIALRANGWRGLGPSVYGLTLLGTVTLAAQYLMAIVFLARISGRELADLMAVVSFDFALDLILARFGPMDLIGLVAGAGLLLTLLRLDPPNRPEGRVAAA